MASFFDAILHPLFGMMIPMGAVWNRLKLAHYHRGLWPGLIITNVEQCYQQPMTGNGKFLPPVKMLWWHVMTGDGANGMVFPTPVFQDCWANPKFWAQECSGSQAAACCWPSGPLGSLGGSRNWLVLSTSGIPLRKWIVPPQKNKQIYIYICIYINMEYPPLYMGL